MVKYTDGNGNLIEIGNELGRGGEASVFSVIGENNVVAKIYNDHHSIDKQKLIKLEKMCSLFDNKIAEYYAWPQQIIYSGRKAIGFTMENINKENMNFDNSEYIKFIKFYVSQDRRKFFPNAEYKFMVHAALNLARAINALHEKGIVIGDINESNVFVNNSDATIKLIDCDSYQIEPFLCDVGKPEYTAPELPNGLRGVKRTSNHDCFALAVMLFLILVGKHPYSGFGTPQEVRQAILQGLYCYGGKTANKNVSAQYPFSEIFNLLNDEIKDLFETAFNSLDRPTAKDWIKELERYENSLVKCLNDDRHWYNPEYGSCIWCALKQDGFYAFNMLPTNIKKNKHNYSMQTPYQNAYRGNSFSIPNYANTNNSLSITKIIYEIYEGLKELQPKEKLKFFGGILTFIFGIWLLIFCINYHPSDSDIKDKNKIYNEQTLNSNTKTPQPFKVQPPSQDSQESQKIEKQPTALTTYIYKADF